jgi:hypothetical protein
MYGKAFGFFYHKGQLGTKGTPVELRNSGIYKWRRISEEKIRPFQGALETNSATT